MMASSKIMIGENIGIEKWKVALAVGGVVAVGAGLYYTIYRKSSQSSTARKKKSAHKTTSEKHNTKTSVNNSTPPPVVDNTPLGVAKQYKSEGNNEFRAHNYDAAIACYDRAIQACPAACTEDLATFYQNRAAAHEHKQEWTNVVRDCSAALQYNQRYNKALLRRARACEHLEDLDLALEDYTAVCIIEAFSNQDSLVTVDRLLKQIGMAHAKTLFAVPRTALPSSRAVAAYLAGFCEDPATAAATTATTTSTTSTTSNYGRALRLMREGKYEEVLPCCDSALRHLSDTTAADTTAADTTAADTTAADTTAAETTAADNTAADNTATDNTGTVDTSDDKSNADVDVDVKEHTGKSSGDVGGVVIGAMNGNIEDVEAINGNADANHTTQVDVRESKLGDEETKLGHKETKMGDEETKLDDKQSKVGDKEVASEVEKKGNEGREKQEQKKKEEKKKEEEVSMVEQRAHLLLVRGAMYVLYNNKTAAASDFQALADTTDAPTKARVAALVKLGTLSMAHGNSDDSATMYERALQLDPSSADAFHQRGQMHLLLNDIEAAIEDFNKVTLLRPDFAIGYIQKLHTDYRFATFKGDVAAAAVVMRKFESACDKFPDCPEVFLFLTQILIDEERYSDAEQYFKRLQAVDPRNVHALVYRGLLAVQQRGDVQTAQRLLTAALVQDNQCELALENLATISVQTGKLAEGVRLFERVIPLARSLTEMAHYCSLRDAAVAQIKVVKRLGITLPDTPDF